MIELVMAKPKAIVPALGEDIYVLWRLMDVYGSWEEARRWLTYGRHIVGLLERGPKAVLWHIPTAAPTEVFSLVLRSSGGTHLFAIVDPGALPRLPKDFARSVDVVSLVSLLVSDPRYLMVEQDPPQAPGRSAFLVPRDFPHLREYMEFYREVSWEVVKRLERALEGGRR